MDFIKALEQERTRLTQELSVLTSQKQNIEGRITGIEKEIQALDAYETVKAGKTAKKARSTQRCSICKSDQHTARTCPERKAE